jgi:hypothetical protein
LAHSSFEIVEPLSGKQCIKRFFNNKSKKIFKEVNLKRRSKNQKISVLSIFKIPKLHLFNIFFQAVVQPLLLPSSTGSLSTLTPNASNTTLSSGVESVGPHFQAQTYEDSDFETEPDPPDWRLSISADDLAKLKPKERKRQDVINGNNSQLLYCIDLFTLVLVDCSKQNMSKI